ncbi:MAG: membrane protein insertase YidC, partial [Clostridiales bacterium]|nr:membrane protein insertase YidC [Clostridiales bacterium]
MNLFTVLYLLIIRPLELMFEMIFAVTNRLVPHPGIAIIFLSLAVNFLVLPLYKRADAMQVEERDKEAEMADGIAHLKKTFKGDERFMMLQTYYRQNNYSPTHVLKGSVSLFLQIPFFMAAYRFLSGMKLIKGVSFGPISDLGAPDNMFTIMGFGINVLPILMTIISLVSAYIYTKGLPAKSRIQLFVMAAFFLVFLYNSPSGLAFYWLLNNVFSMMKNIFYRLKRPGLVLSVIAAICGAALIAYAPMTHYYTSRIVNLTLAGIALIIPFILV